MSWRICYHADVADDLERVGSAAARRIMRILDCKLPHEPLQFGGPLSGLLSGFRKLRIGDYRVVYQVVEQQVIVFVLAIGPRRDKEIYRAALKRV